MSESADVVGGFGRYDHGMTTKVGKYAKKSPQERATHVRKATSQVKAKAAIDFVRTVRGK